MHKKGGDFPAVSHSLVLFSYIIPTNCGKSNFKPRFNWVLLNSTRFKNCHILPSQCQCVKLSRHAPYPLCRTPEQKQKKIYHAQFAVGSSIFLWLIAANSRHFCNATCIFTTWNFHSHTTKRYSFVNRAFFRHFHFFLLASRAHIFSSTANNSV